MDLYTDPETVLGVAADRHYASFNGEDLAETNWALRREAVLFDVPEKPWQFEGPDVLPFLERIFARRIGDLPEGRGRYTVACTPDGGTFMDGILSSEFHLEGQYAHLCFRRPLGQDQGLYLNNVHVLQNKQLQSARQTAAHFADRCSEAFY